jgi:hypothetical protein
VLPQQSQSTSINHASTISHLGISGDEQGDRGAVPMELEENPPPNCNKQEVPDNESAHS